MIQGIHAGDLLPQSLAWHQNTTVNILRYSEPVFREALATSLAMLPALSALYFIAYNGALLAILPQPAAATPGFTLHRKDQPP